MNKKKTSAAATIARRTYVAPQCSVVMLFPGSHILDGSTLFGEGPAAENDGWAELSNKRDKHDQSDNAIWKNMSK